MVFPEGTRSIDGHVTDFKKGAAILAYELRTPIVPVGIRGTFEAWPRGGGFRLHPVEIHIGDPIDPDRFKARSIHGYYGDATREGQGTGGSGLTELREPSVVEKSELQHIVKLATQNVAIRLEPPASVWRVDSFSGLRFPQSSRSSRQIKR